MTQKEQKEVADLKEQLITAREANAVLAQGRHNLAIENAELRRDVTMLERQRDVLTQALSDSQDATERIKAAVAMGQAVGEAINAMAVMAAAGEQQPQQDVQ